MDENDDDTEAEKCSICMERFRRPKLLPCAHSFCTDCLYSLISSSGRKDEIICPLCRKHNPIPRTGIEDFISNYFVKSFSAVFTCFVCNGISSKSNECENCGLEVCPSCSLNHSRDTTNGTNRCVRSTIGDNDLEEYERGIRSLRHHVKTFYCGVLEFSFRCHTAQCINKIIPLPGNQAWILSDNNPRLTKYNYLGQQLTSLDVGHRVNDACVFNDFLVVLCEDGKAILRYKGSAITGVISIDEQEQASCVLPLGNELAIGITEKSINITCKLNFYDTELKLLRSMDSNEIGSFTWINSMALNALSQHICLADEQNMSVRLIWDMERPRNFVKTMFPTRYRGGGFNDPRYQGFRPRSLCSDSTGNVFIYDHASAMILVIDTRAELVGVVLANDDDRTGDPNFITFDECGKLWVGDEFTGKIRVYNMEKIFNECGPGAAPGIEESFEMPSVTLGMGGQTNPLASDAFERFQEIVGTMPQDLNLESMHTTLEKLRSVVRQVGLDPDVLGRVNFQEMVNQYGFQTAAEQIGLNPNMLHGIDTDAMLERNGLNPLSFKHNMGSRSSNSIPNFHNPNAASNFDGINTSPFNQSQGQFHNFQASQNLLTPRTINVPVYMGPDGNPVLSEFQNDLNMSQFTNGVQSGPSGIGVFRRGFGGTELQLPQEVLNNPELKRYIIQKISQDTGVSEEQLERSIRS